MKSYKHILSLLFIVLFIFLAFGSFFENKNEKKTYTIDSDGSIRIDAIRLFKEYSDNPVAADEKFKGRILKIDGNVSLITQGDEGKVTIIIEANDLNGYIFCHFPSSQADKISKIKKGDYKTIKGRCTGMLIGVILVDCEFF